MSELPEPERRSRSRRCGWWWGGGVGSPDYGFSRSTRTSSSAEAFSLLSRRSGRNRGAGPEGCESHRQRSPRGRQAPSGVRLSRSASNVPTLLTPSGLQPGHRLLGSDRRLYSRLWAIGPTASAMCSSAVALRLALIRCRPSISRLAGCPGVSTGCVLGIGRRFRSRCGRRSGRRSTRFATSSRVRPCCFRASESGRRPSCSCCHLQTPVNTT